MKRKQLFVMITVAFALVFTIAISGSLIHAQGQFSGYKSTIQTYNMSDTTANIILAFTGRTAAWKRHSLTSSSATAPRSTSLCR